MSNPTTADLDLTYQLAFDAAPVGMALSRSRTIVDCNQALCDMFGAPRSQLVGQSFEQLYPSADEFERTGERITPVLNAKGTYSDNRIMRRAGGRTAGETFWCHVTGRALLPADPHAAGIWCFEDLSHQRPIVDVLTPREREVAALLMQGLTSKAIGRVLDISHRTVEIYRAKLMRKYNAHTTADLVRKLTTAATQAT
jgi:PAS domain S-box-containing protein